MVDLRVDAVYSMPVRSRRRDIPSFISPFGSEGNSSPRAAVMGGVFRWWLLAESDSALCRLASKPSVNANTQPSAY